MKMMKMIPFPLAVIPNASGGVLEENEGTVGAGTTYGDPVLREALRIWVADWNFIQVWLIWTELG